MKLLSMIYYLGIITCGIQGSKKSCQQHKGSCLPASFLNAMGGGMIRDLFMLFVFPAAFTTGCISDDIIALCAGGIYRIFLLKYENNNTFKQIVIFADALSVGSFIAIGIDKALSLGANQGTALCCGVITALGGGILSELLCGQSIHNVLTNNTAYRIITTLGAYIYIHCLTIGINPIVAQYWLVLYTFSFIPITNYSSGEILINIMNIHKYFKVMINPIPTVVVLSQQNTFYLHISKHSLLPYFSGTSNYIQSKNLFYMNHAVILLNFKLRCPRRFARGR